MTPDQLTPDQHRTRLRRLGQLRQRAERLQQQMPSVARAARAAGLPIAEIATLLGVHRVYAHRLVHGRSDRMPEPTRQSASRPR